MKLVADANVLFSALLRKGMTRRLWFHPEARLYAPEFLMQEAAGHQSELLKKYAGTREEVLRMLGLLARQVELVPDSKLLPYLPAATALSSDSKDWLYLACALHVDAAIWTHDKEFQRQKRVKIKTTQELAEELGLL
ncbi:MAG: PIN domain-containing protein [Candidatus Micrarchaeia archaeon]